MPHSLADPPGQLQLSLRRRLREASCLTSASTAARLGNAGPNAQGASPGLDSEAGSAVVEFTFLALLLMVPVVYFVVTVGQLQGGSFAVAGAADQAAKAFVAQKDAAVGAVAANQSVLLALNDYGHTADQASVDITCDREDCLSPGTMVTVTVHLEVPLPLVPFGDALQLKAGRLSASSSQVVGRYQ